MSTRRPGFDLRTPAHTFQTLMTLTMTHGVNIRIDCMIVSSTLSALPCGIILTDTDVLGFHNVFSDLTIEPHKDVTLEGVTEN